MPDIIKSPETSGPFLELIASAEEIHVDEVIAPPKKTRDGFYTYYVKVRPKQEEEIKPPETRMEDLSDEYLLKNAELLLGSDEFILARSLFSVLLERNIRHHGALMGLGHCLRHLGQLTSAKKCFQAVSELYQDSGAFLALAQCHAEQEDDEAATQLLEQIEDLDKLTPEQKFDMLKTWGNCLNRLNELEAAQEKYEEALKLDSRSDSLFINLGTLSMQNKAFEEAERYFERALEINPRSAKASCGLGLVALEKDSIGLAQKHFLDAHRKDPANKVAALQIAANAHRTNEFDVAEIALQGALEKDPLDHEVRYALASIYFSRENWNQCETEVNEILSRHANHERAIKLRSALTQQRVKPELPESNRVS